MVFFLMIRRPPRSTPLPYPPLFRSKHRACRQRRSGEPSDPASPAARAEDLGIDLSHLPIGHTARSEEHTSELQSRQYLVCRLLLEKKKKSNSNNDRIAVQIRDGCI